MEGDVSSFVWVMALLAWRVARYGFVWGYLLLYSTRFDPEYDLLRRV